MIAKGIITFRLGKSGLETNIMTMDDLINEFEGACQNAAKEYYETKFKVSDETLISGINFLSDVDEHGIIDEDGSLVNVLVDGYVSNLGLSHEYFSQGQFLVTADIWKELCGKYNIQVEWANK